MALGVNPDTGKFDPPTSKGGAINGKGFFDMFSLPDLGGISNTTSVGRFGDVYTGETSFGQPDINFGSVGNYLVYGALIVGGIFAAKFLFKKKGG